MKALEAIADGLYAVMSDSFVAKCAVGYGRRRWQRP